jgi:large subunit ribosomal protein L35
MPSRSGVAAGRIGRRGDPVTKGCEMPKLKNKSAAKKRFRFTGTGKIRAAVACKRHNLRKRPQKMKRQARGTMILPKDATVVAEKYFPYA